MKVVISTSSFQSQVADLLPCNNGRKSQLTFALLKSYRLLDKFDHVISFPLASINDMRKFHSEEYLKMLFSEHDLADANNESVLQLAETAADFYRDYDVDIDDQSQWFADESELYQYYKTKYTVQQVEDVEIDTGSLSKYGLLHDCPRFPYLSMYLSVITGATLSLSDHLDRRRASIAINWDGGRHHAFKNHATGFCYVNDIVLLIQSLRRKGWQKISYIDFDLHYGDGVSKAMQFSGNVQTISLHLYELGFFPGTGSLNDTKNSKEMINIPLLHGLDDMYLDRLIEEIILPLLADFDADCIIIQCGSDGLGGDKYNEWQLSIRGLTRAIISVMQLFRGKQIVLLGGGGYNELLVSRFYLYLTDKVLSTFTQFQSSIEEAEEETLRDHEFIELYKDESYRFWSYDINGELKKCLRNDNKLSYLHELKDFYHL